MRVLLLTLARAGSKGVPGKNVKPLGGKPLIQWTIDACCQYIDNGNAAYYAISTDDYRVIDIAKINGVFTIPEDPVPDRRSRLVSLQAAVKNQEDWYHRPFGFVVDVRCTNPFITSADIGGVVNLLSTTDAESVISVTKLEDHHPARIKWLTEEGYLRSFVDEPPDGLRQNLKPDAYIRNGAIYGYRRDVIMAEDARLFGHDKSIGYIMPPERSINIDTPLDWKMAQMLMRERLGL